MGTFMESQGWDRIIGGRQELHARAHAPQRASLKAGDKGEGRAKTYRSPAVLLYGFGDPRTAGEVAVPRVPTGTGSAILRNLSATMGICEFQPTVSAIH